MSGTQNYGQTYITSPFPHPKGNPNRALLETLYANGVKMYQCNVAIKLKEYEPQDLLAFSRLVESGIGALVDLEKSGYLPMTL